MFTEDNDEDVPDPDRWGFREDMMNFYEEGATNELFKLSIAEQIAVAGVVQYVARHTLAHALVS